ncbi:MAG: spondin domain-containing protein [Planctomycetota bacterium]
MKNVLAIAALSLTAGAAQASSITVTIENTAPAGDFSFTPFWLAVHDGSFDSYDGGAPAADFPGITEIAEGGDTSVIMNRFASENPNGVDLTLAEGNGAPVFSPGESASTTINVGDATTNRYFSYASMVVPTNDLFVANGNPFAHEVFDAAGNFTGPFEILIFGRDVNDNGTEVNNALGGAAFSANGGTEADEFLNVRNFFTVAGDQDYLDSFLNSNTADGGTITSAFTADTLIARITVVPAPATTGLLAAGALVGIRRRR